MLKYSGNVIDAYRLNNSLYLYREFEYEMKVSSCLSTYIIILSCSSLILLED